MALAELRAELNLASSARPSHQGLHQGHQGLHTCGVHTKGPKGSRASEHPKKGFQGSTPRVPFKGVTRALYIGKICKNKISKYAWIP